MSKNDKNAKNFIKNNNNNKKMFQLKKNYTGEKEFSLRLRQLDGSAPKNFSNKVSICFAIRPKKSFKKRKMITWLLIHLLLEAFKVQPYISRHW